MPSHNCCSISGELVGELSLGSTWTSLALRVRCWLLPWGQAIFGACSEALPVSLGNASCCRGRRRSSPADNEKRSTDWWKVILDALCLHQQVPALDSVPLVPSECQKKKNLCWHSDRWMWSAQRLSLKFSPKCCILLLLKLGCWDARKLLCPLCDAWQGALWPFSCSSGWSPAWLGLGSCWSQCAVPVPEERRAVKHWPVRLGQMLTRTVFACPSLDPEGAVRSWGWHGFYKLLNQGPLLGHL